MTSRMVPTWLLIVVVAAAGGLGGMYLTHVWQNWDWRVEWQRRARQSEWEATESARRLNDPVGWRRDSILTAVARARQAGRPREVRRTQVGPHCVVDFAIQDSIGPMGALFSAEARGRGFDGRVVARGYAYRAGGFAPGETAHVVMPEVYCSDILVSGWTFGTLLADSLRLYVR